jgi:hypothetical protein
MAIVYQVEDLGSPHTGERLALHQARLNALALAGWELVAVNGSVVYLRQDTADSAKPDSAPPEKSDSDTETGTHDSANPESRQNAQPEGGRRRR